MSVVYFRRVPRLVCLVHLVHWGQDHEALFALLDEPVQAVLFMLIKSDFLAKHSEVKGERWVRDHHLESHLAKLMNEGGYLLVDVLALVVGDGQDHLNFLHQIIAKLVAYHFVENLPPVALILFAKNV